MRGAIEMRPKCHAIFTDAAQLAVAEHLKATTVGEHRTVPRDEAVQAAQFVNELVTRPEIQVVSVAKDDLGAQRLEVLLGNGLNCTCRAHRHEYGSRDLAMCGCDLPQPRLGAWIGSNEFETQGVSCWFEDALSVSGHPPSG